MDPAGVEWTAVRHGGGGQNVNEVVAGTALRRPCIVAAGSRTAQPPCRRVAGGPGTAPLLGQPDRREINLAEGLERQYVGGFDPLLLVDRLAREAGEPLRDVGGVRERQHRV